MKIKVMKADGRDATFSSYFLRFLIRPVDTFYAIGLAFMFFTKKCQRIGDLAAGTIVVDVPEPVSLKDLDPIKVKTESDTVRFPEAGQLKDSDITFIRAILTKRLKDPGHKSVVRLAEKIQEVLGVSSDMKPFTFLRAIVRDYELIHG